MNQETKLYNELINLIKVSSGRFAAKFISRYDYLDFHDEGIWILGLCMVKWKEKGKSFDDSIGFKKYFKTSLFNRFRQLEIKAFCKKSAGIKIDFDPDSLTKKNANSYKDRNFPFDRDSVKRLSCDGGFGEIHFKELVDHVSSLLSVKEKRIFKLMTDPPEELVMSAIWQNSRKRKMSIINGSYNSHKVKISGSCLYQFLAKSEDITRQEFSNMVNSIREMVKKIVVRKEYA